MNPTPGDARHAGAAGPGASPPGAEDAVVARLALALGVLDADGLRAVQGVQAQAHAAGRPLTFSQALVQSGRVPPEHLLRLKQELGRCYRPCPSCGRGRYLAPGPQPRTEPCPACGAGVPVPPTDSDPGAVARREVALLGSGRFRGPVTSGAGSATEGGGARTVASARERAQRATEGDVQAARAFGSYLIEAEVARGGMGAIYRARRADTGERCALKVVLQGEKASEVQLHRFRREARAQQELDHPHILRIHDAGAWEGILYYAMDLVEGPDLARAAPGLELHERVRILADVARAAHHAHEHGYVHRDLKPSNVLLQGGRHALVTDFGLAKNLGGQTRLTAEGQAVGTPFYMSPEQAAGQLEQVGPRSDVYSLGCMLYELCTGQLPFQSDSVVELFRMIVETRARTFAELGCSAPPVLEQVALMAMEKVPEDRYPSAAALADDLERFLRGEAPLGRQVGAAVRLARTVESHRRSIGFVLGVVVLGLVALIGLALGARLVRRHIEAERALTTHAEACARAAGRLEAGLGLVAAGRTAEAEAALDAALEEARGVLEAPPGSPEAAARAAAVRARVRAALLVRGRLGLERATAGGARAALAAATLALELAAQDAGSAAPAAAQVEERRVALELQARARLRLGHGPELEVALGALREAAGAGSARVALLEGQVALVLGPRAAALPAFDRAASERALAADALLGRVQALFLLGREAEAREALVRAREALGASAAARRRAGLALVACGRRGEALVELRAALEQEPDTATARRFLAVALGVGRPVEAAAALESAVRRSAGDPDLEALWLRARLHLGEDVAARVAALASESREAALLRADLAAATAVAERARPEALAAIEAAYAALVEAAEADPRARAARARARAARADAPGARADLEALGAALADVPQDVPPAPDLARAVRDAGWARLLLGERDAAAALARAALRGLPLDLDAALLLARSEAAPAALETVRQAFVEEVEALDGALGRGLLLARLANVRRSPELARLARPLLVARLAGDPALAPVTSALRLAAALAGDSAPAAAGDGPDEATAQVDWAALLPPCEPRPPLAPAAAERARLVTDQAFDTERGNDRAAVALLQEALALDPDSVQARWEMAARRCRYDASLDALGEWIPYLRCRPNSALPILLQFRADWRTTYRMAPLEPHDEVDRLLARDPEDPVHRTAWVLEHTLGILYPADRAPGWRAAAPGEVRRWIDGVLRRDPRLVGLLYLRAQLADQDGLCAGVERDLALVQAVAHDDLDHAGVPDRVFGEYYRLWVLAAGRPDEALGQLARLDPRAPMVKGFQEYIQAWLHDDARLARLRTHPAFERFARELGR